MRARYAVLLQFDLRVSIMPDAAIVKRSYTTLEAARRCVRRVSQDGLWIGRGHRRMFYPASRLVSARISPR